MKKEIEYKFLLNKMPNLSYEPQQITQVYFDFMKKDKILTYLYKSLEYQKIAEARVRRIKFYDDTKYFLTLKTAGTISRIEKELEIDSTMAEELVKDAAILTIIKNRYVVKIENMIVEIDKFLNTKKPLVIAEVEFDSIANLPNAKEVMKKISKALKVKCTDVTENLTYKNKNLKNFIRGNEDEGQCK